MKQRIYEQPIMMPEEYWMNTHFSVARHVGRIKYNGNAYVICDKLGRDIFECSEIAEREGREKAIGPGEPADLVIEDWLPVYRAVGRERFIEIAKSTADLAKAKEMAGIKRTRKKKTGEAPANQ